MSNLLAGTVLSVAFFKAKINSDKYIRYFFFFKNLKYLLNITCAKMVD